MDFIKDNMKTLYRKYLTASLSGAVVTSIYSFIDTIAVGQSVGPSGAAAMAVITPLYAITTFLAILCGIGGGVLMTNAKAEGTEEKGNAYFTASVILLVGVTVAAWLLFAFFHNQIFLFFGADRELLPTVMKYARWIIGFYPMFILITFLGAVIRNDGNPRLVMFGMIVGGCLNVFGDWFFCFPLNMGMDGAAIATVIGTCTQVFIMCSHFFTKKCRLRFVKPFNIGRAFRKIISIGFGTGVLDLGVVILAILINNQIMRYGDANALAVYGVVVTVSSLLQSLFVGVGQAIQPLVSANYGARKIDRLQAFWKMGFSTVIIMGVLFTAIGEIFPEQITAIFINATPEVLEAAPGIIRPYFLLFLFLGSTVLSTYYLQAMKFGKVSLILSLLRGLVVSGLFMLLLPLIFGIQGVWLAMPVSELLVAILALSYIRYTNQALKPE